MTVGGFFKALRNPFTKKREPTKLESLSSKPVKEGNKRAFTVKIKNEPEEYTRYVPKYTAEEKKKRNAITFRLRELRKLVADKEELENKIETMKKSVLQSNALTKEEKNGIEAGEFDLTGVYPNGKAPRRNTAASLAVGNIGMRLKGIKRNLSNISKTAKYKVKEATKSNYWRAKNLVENMGKKNINISDFEKKKKEFYTLLGRRGPFGFRTIKRESEEELRKNFQKILNARKEENNNAYGRAQLKRAEEAAKAAKEKRIAPSGALGLAAASAAANSAIKNKKYQELKVGNYQEINNNNGESNTEEISIAAAKMGK